MKIIFLLTKMITTYQKIILQFTIQMAMYISLLLSFHLHIAINLYPLRSRRYLTQSQSPKITQISNTKNNNKQKKQTTKQFLNKQQQMSGYQHRRNFSLITTQPHPSNKIKSTNRSLRKIQNQAHQNGGHLQTGVKGESQNYQWLLIAAKQYYHKTNNLHAAIHNFQQYLTHNPSHQESLYLCAVCYMHLEEYSRAIQKLKDYLSTKKNTHNGLNLSLNRKLIINSNMQLPNMSRAYLLLSMAYNKVNNVSKAIEAVNQALKNDNKFQQGYCFRAKLYLKLSENQKAFFDYKQVLKCNNKCWAAWVGLGDYYTQVINYQQGLKCYQKAKQLIQLQKQSLRSTENGLANQQQRQTYQQENIKQMQQQLGRQSGNESKKDRYLGKVSKINDKISQFVKKPRQSFQFNSEKEWNRKIEQKQTYNKPKMKVALRALTSPYSQLNNNFIKTPTNKNPQQQLHKNQHNIVPLEQQSKTQLLKQIELKIAICLYYLGQYARSILNLQGLLVTNKALDYHSEIYYYLAINQLKVYEQNRYQKGSIRISVYTLRENNQQGYQDKNSNPQAKQKSLNIVTTSSTSSQKPRNLPQITNQLTNPSLQIQKKQLQLTPFQLLHQSILNFQTSIISNNNKKIMIKSYKTLIKLYIENNQFYQTQSVLKLGVKYQLQKQEYNIKEYKTLCEVCMLVIRQKYEQATIILKNLYDVIVSNGNNKNGNKNVENQVSVRKAPQSEMPFSKRQKNTQKAFQKSKQKQKHSSITVQKPNQKPKIPKKPQHQQQTDQQNSNKNRQQKQPQKQSQQLQNQIPRSKSKSKQKKQNKQQSTRLHIDIKNMKKNVNVNNGHVNDLSIDSKQEDDLQYNQFKNISIRNRISCSSSPKNQNFRLMINLQSGAHYENHVGGHTPHANNISLINNSIFTNQFNWMIPVVLLFRAYAEYFSDNFIECLEIYEHYENFIKDYLGKQPDNDIYLSYNKVLCEGILMLDNEMIEESIEKFMLAVDNYYRLMKNLAVEPILFRAMGLMRLAVSQSPFLSEQINSRSKIFSSILQTLDHYMPAIKNNALVHYYYSLALYELQRYKQASDCLEKCLKIAEQCTWKFLYVKGVVEIKNKLYKQAIRQFSAGLLVEQKSQIYLGRCICYIQLFDQSQGENQAYMQRSFEDLQKFIELEQDKDKISKWVTKILFFNRAYEQVTKSIKKVSVASLQNQEDMIKISKYLNIYNGIFQDGGVLGQMLINAFEGKFEQSSIQINGERHEAILSDYVESKYKKWLNILNLYSSQRYNELIKLLQLTIFEQKNQQQAVELRYNLAIVYYLSGQSSKADNVLALLPKHFSQISSRVQRFINRDFSQDQCVDDLQRQCKGMKRLSSYLPYRRIQFRSKGISLEPQKSIFIKISLPFPNFFKPDIDLNLDDTFMYGQTSQMCIPKKIQAPWIRKVTGHIQFTDNIIESQDTSIFQHDVLQPGSEPQQQQSLSVGSSIRNP